MALSVVVIVAADAVADDVVIAVAVVDVVDAVAVVLGCC